MQKHSVLVQLMYAFLSSGRVFHCMRVTRLALEHAHKCNVNFEDAFLAGISHDICREYSDAQLLHCAHKAALHVNAYELEKPILLHGKVAPVILQQYYPMSQHVYAAIATHTLGCEAANSLQKLIYVCDALDEQRSMWTSAEGHVARESMVRCKSIDEMLFLLIVHMERVFGMVHSVTYAMKQSLVHN